MKVENDALSQSDWLAKELEAVFHNSYESIFVTDGNGKVLRVSETSLYLCDLRSEELVGKSVFDLERNWVFYPSATKKVIESGKKESVIQTTKSGRTLLVEATPIKDNSGKLIRVVSISRDISEAKYLKEQLAELNMLVQGYQRELIRLQQERMEEKSLIIKSKAMADIFEIIKQVAYTDTTILITGETGVGKEVVASNIHLLSRRNAKPFIALNCGAIPDNLLESELFGYEDGSFTGARKGGRAGVFELANKGTVFFDEIGELPIHLQVKLLRVLQEKKVKRIGGMEKEIDIRVIAATNQDLEKMTKENRFRRDLYYRINVIPIVIPPLRDRKEDLYHLIYHFLAKFNKKYDKSLEIPGPMLEDMLGHKWPGNVRELENWIERFVVTGQKFMTSASGEIQLPIGKSWHEGGARISLPKVLEEVEKELLVKAKQQCSTTREMALLLGIDQSTVVRKLQRYGL